MTAVISHQTLFHSALTERRYTLLQRSPVGPAVPLPAERVDLQTTLRAEQRPTQIVCAQDNREIFQFPLALVVMSCNQLDGVGRVTTKRVFRLVAARDSRGTCRVGTV